MIGVKTFGEKNYTLSVALMELRHSLRIFNEQPESGPHSWKL